MDYGEVIPVSLPKVSDSIVIETWHTKDGRARFLSSFCSSWGEILCYDAVKKNSVMTAG